MGKVLKADASAGDAYAAFVMSPDQSEVWVTFDLAVAAAALAFWSSNLSGAFAWLRLLSGSPLAGPSLGGTSWVDQVSSDTGGSFPTANVYHTCELHYYASTAREFYVDGTLVYSSVPGSTLARTLFIGQFTATNDPAAVAYIDNVKVGTTRGGTDIFADDFEGGDLSAWTTTTGDVSVVDDPFALTGPEGICIAFDDGPLVAQPTWTRIDGDPYNLGYTFAINRGRNNETEETGTGTCSISIHDPDGLLDPTNTTSPFYGKIKPRLQAAVARWSPTTETWSTRFRGYVSRLIYEMPISGIAEVTLELADAFDFFADIAMMPGDHGDTPPAASTGDIYFAGGSTIPAQNVFKHVDQRIIQALDDIGWPGTGNGIDVPNLRNIFSGNVSVQEAVYDRYSGFLQVVRDAADAEFPGLANVFMSREGVFTFFGRYRRFFPDRPEYGVNFWEAGGSAEALADDTVALIQSFVFGLEKDDMTNRALALPQGVDETDVPGNLVEDATSITDFGLLPMDGLVDLLTWHGHNDDLSETTAVEETLKFAQFYVDNRKTPYPRITQLVFTMRDPEQSSATANWALLQGVEIGDNITVTTTHRGGGGFAEDFFVEGITEVDEAMGEYNKVTMTLTVSPGSWYSVNPFGSVDTGGS